jgi:hypothetical protein
VILVINKYGFLLEFIPAEAGAGMTNSQSRLFIKRGNKPTQREP